jgi:uncharacterized protein YcbK (DUF882 family)
MSTVPSRRFFIGSIAAAAAGILLPKNALAATYTPASREPRVLKFAHTHTGEKLAVEYWRDGGYETDGLGAVNQLMRDFRTGDVHEIDPALLDLLHELQVRTETSKPFQIISAYRSPATNSSLREHSSGVASGSLHLKGKAIDIRLGDVPLPQLRRAALASRRGGVGFYPGSDFVHVDTGRIRTW